MKLTKRQLNKIIAESLGIQSRVITEAVNFRKIRKDLFALKADIDNQALLDKVSDHADQLKAKVDAGDSKFFKGRYREAVTLLASLEALLKAPTPEKINDVTEEPIIEDPPEPTPEPTEPEPTPWKPDPDPKVGWEYQVRKCIWYTRKKKTTKEYKLGHASGKPLEKGGKFLDSIVSLNNAYPDLVKDCDPMVKKPTPKKPKPKSGDKFNKLAVLYSETKSLDFNEERVTVDGDRPLADDFKKALFSLQAAEKMINDGKPPRTSAYTDGLDTLKDIFNYTEKVKGGLSSTDRLVQKYMVFDSENKQQAADSVEYVFNELSDIAAEYSKSKNSSIANLGANILSTVRGSTYKLGGQSAEVVAESLSRGSLYRRRYYGRY